MIDTLHRPALSADLIAHALSRHLDRVVLVLDSGERLTARELRDGVSQIVQFLNSLDHQPKRSAMISRNRVEVVEAMVALNFAGVVGTALHPMGTLDDYLYIIEDAEIDTLIFPLRMGWSAAARALMLGDWFSAQDLVDCGMAQAVVPGDQLMAVASSFAARKAFAARRSGGQK